MAPSSQRQRPQGRGPGGRRRRQPDAPATSAEELTGWFAGSLPDDWFTGPVEIVFDRDEILVTGGLAVPDAGAGDASTAATARIETFRETTRVQRMAIADVAQRKFGRVVSWTAKCGDHHVAFTIASVPVMTRLSIEERAVLDTLIDAGVARSRSEALAWCVELVSENEDDWIGRLRDAMSAVEDVRADGPDSRS